MSDCNVTELIDVRVVSPELAGVYGWYLHHSSGGRICVLVGKSISMSVGARLNGYLVKDNFVDLRKNASPETVGPVFAEFVIKCLARLCQSRSSTLSVRRIGDPMNIVQNDQRAVAFSLIAELQAWLDYTPTLQSKPVKLDKKYKSKWMRCQQSEAEACIREYLLADFFNATS